MKNAPVQTANEGAGDTANYTPGTLPKLTNPVVAAVLASLLESKAMTGLESVFKQSTTRLSAVIYYLENKYDWHIDRRAVATGTNDGRIAEVSAYWLPQATIGQAFEDGAREWVDEVLQARAKRRKQVDKCKRIAKYKNIARKIDPRQAAFWEGASC